MRLYVVLQEYEDGETVVAGVHTTPEAAASQPLVCEHPKRECFCELETQALELEDSLILHHLSSVATLELHASRVRDDLACMATSPGGAYRCTRLKGHRGEHGTRGITTWKDGSWT